MKKRHPLEILFVQVLILMVLLSAAFEIVGVHEMERQLDNEAAALHDFCQSQGHDRYYDTGGFFDRNNTKSSMSITCVDEDGTSHFYDLSHVNVGGVSITSMRLG